MNKLIFGHYMPGDSLIHRLGPQAKLLANFYFIGIIFLTNSWETYLLLAFFTLLSVFLSRVDLEFFIRGIHPLIWLILFAVALQVLFTSGGETYQNWGVLHITEFDVMDGLFIFCRFVLIIFMSTLLALTIPPLELSDTVEHLFRPLKAIWFPVHEIPLVLSIILRFVPTSMDETGRVMSIQRARDVDFDEGNLVQKMKAVIPLLIPLFVNSFNRAGDLATAMEARGYKDGEGGTKYRVLHWHNRDTMVTVALILLTVLLIFLRG